MNTAEEITYRLAADGEEIGEYTMADILGQEAMGTLNPETYYLHGSGEWRALKPLVSAARMRHSQSNPPAPLPALSQPHPTLASAAARPVAAPGSGYTPIFYLLAFICFAGGVLLGVLFFRHDGGGLMAALTIGGGLVQAILFAAIGRALELLTFIHTDTRALLLRR